MAINSNDIANEAVVMMGGNAPAITGVAPNFDSSTLGKIAARIYASTVAMIARQFAWDFARTVAALATSGNAAPFPWTYEYVYPAGCVQVWQIAPAALVDPNNPLPTEWAIGVAQIAGVQSKVIWSNVQTAQAIFNGNPAESTWDALFRQSVVRALASAFAMGAAGKPDVAQTMLEGAGTFESLGERRDS
jgi:hypothetical protein